MNCDCRKPDSCKLRIYADEYGADQKKYRSEQRKPVIKQYTHESIVYEQEKCIKCGLCVGITAGEKELTGLTFIGRGFDVRIGVPFTRELGEALTLTAAKCAKACPTAAISMKIRDK
jgi:NADH dehydrogenase/NADH:ubiquinone oxidoreductase subunit G